eukprot:2464332-Amphidinium_carterae.1
MTVQIWRRVCGSGRHLATHANSAGNVILVGYCGVILIGIPQRFFDATGEVLPRVDFLFYIPRSTGSKACTPYTPLRPN